MYASPSWDVSKVTTKQKHTHLDCLIEALESRLNSKEPANRSLVSLLSSLASHLEMHFELEMPERNFTCAALKNPRFAREVERLEGERTGLLSDVEELICMAKLAFAQRAETRPVAERYRAFQNRFAAHEEAEKRLVQEVFCADPSLGS